MAVRHRELYSAYQSRLVCRMLALTDVSAEFTYLKRGIDVPQQVRTFAYEIVSHIFTSSMKIPR